MSDLTQIDAEHEQHSSHPDPSQIAKNLSFVQVKCGSVLMYGDCARLIAASEFLESMISLNACKESSRIDLSSFCCDDGTLVSFILYAGYDMFARVQWTSTSTANMIFLVEPLQLSKQVQQYITKNLADLVVDIGALIGILDTIITQRQPSEVKIENVLTFLIGDITEMTDDEQRQHDLKRTDHNAQELERQRRSTTLFFPCLFRDSLRARPQDIIALITLALWLKLMHSQAIFVDHLALIGKYYVEIGTKPPAFLKDCGKVVKGLMPWIKLVYVT